MMQVIKKEHTKIYLKYQSEQTECKMNEGIDLTLKWINDRYISIRTKFVEQYNDKENGEARYNTLGVNKNSKESTLADYVIKQHLQQKRTIGVFAATSGTKFICFDVDYQDLIQAREMALSIVQTLLGEFGLEENEILLTFSGSKGYHVEVFFNKLVPNWKAKRFYDLMLRIVEASSNEVELRPTHGQAVKLPLSLNRKTGKKCSIINKQYLYEMEDESLLDIQPIDFSSIEELFEDLEDFYPEKREEISISQESKEETSSNMNVNFSEVVQIDYIKRVLEAGTLIESNSRHNTVLGIASLWNTEGRKQEDGLKVIWNIIQNTRDKYPQFIDKTWTLEKLRQETERVVELVYKSNLKLGVKAKPVFITKEDVLFTLQAKTQKQREMIMIMVVHSKKYANEDGEFFLTNKQIVDYGGTANRSRMKKHWDELNEQGLIETIQTNRYSGRTMLVNGKELAVKDPNWYKVINSYESNDKGLEIKAFDVKDFKQLIADVLTIDEIKDAIGLTAYYNHYSSFFSK